MHAHQYPDAERQKSHEHFVSCDVTLLIAWTKGKQAFLAGEGRDDYRYHEPALIAEFQSGYDAAEMSAAKGRTYVH